MKNILILSSALFLASCSNNDECNCSQLRWQRTVEYQGTTDNEVATTGWNGTGIAEALSNDDCSQDGTVGEKGVVSSQILPNGNTEKVEYEYRITCLQ